MLHFADQCTLESEGAGLLLQRMTIGTTISIGFLSFRPRILEGSLMSAWIAVGRPFGDKRCSLSEDDQAPGFQN